ncbi:hypothetical protein D3C72_1200000 [compost metagenome]
MHITDHRLNWRDNQRHPQRHGKHVTNSGRIVTAQKMPGRRCTHEQGAAQECRNGHMEQAIGEGGVKHHREPVDRDHHAVDDLIPLRGLHPAVGRQDPEGRNNGAQRHHAGGKEVQPRPDFVPAKQHHPEETGFEEEGGQHFVGQQRAGNTPRELRKSAPVGPELVGHHQPGHHAHAKVDGENFGPEMVQRAPDGVFGLEPKPFQHRQIAGETNGDRRENNVEGYGKGKLYPRQMKSI